MEEGMKAKPVGLHGLDFWRVFGVCLDSYEAFWLPYLSPLVSLPKKRPSPFRETSLS